ncbi:MAG: hypothetical protein AAB501_03970 [Patescibacteria group bacterium]
MTKTEKGKTVLVSGDEARRIQKIMNPKRGEESDEEKEYMARVNRWLRNMPRLDGDFSPM